jgi:hypothetical protein
VLGGKDPDLRLSIHRVRLAVPTVWCRPQKTPLSSRNWHSYSTLGTVWETLMSGVCRRAAELRNTVYGGRRRVPGAVRRGAPSVSEPTLSVNRGVRQGQTRLGWTARRARWTRWRSGGRSSQRSRDQALWQQSLRLRLPPAPASRADRADCGDRLRAHLRVDTVASRGPNSSCCCVSGSADRTVDLRTPSL